MLYWPCQRGDGAVGSHPTVSFLILGKWFFNRGVFPFTIPATHLSKHVNGAHWPGAPLSARGYHV